MTVLRMDNVLLVVDDLDAAKASFAEPGLELEALRAIRLAARRRQGNRGGLVTLAARHQLAADEQHEGHENRSDL